MKPKRILRTILIILFWLSLWQIAAFIVHKELLIPGPLVVLQHLLQLLQTAAFYQACLTTLLRILEGFAIGLMIGIILAMLAYRFQLLKGLLDPAIRTIRSVPVTSFIILIMLWTSYHRVPTVVAALMVVPILYTNLSEGLKALDHGLIEVGHAYRFSKGKMLMSVYLPMLKPYLLAGLSMAIGLAWKAGIGAEIIALPAQAIGTQIYYSKLYLETADLFAYTIIAVFFSTFLDWLVGLLLKKEGEAHHEAQ